MSSAFCFPWRTPSGLYFGKFLQSKMFCSGCHMLCPTFNKVCSALNAVSIPSLSIACLGFLAYSCTAPRTPCVYIRAVFLTDPLPVVLRLAGRLFCASLWLVGF